MSKNNKSKNQQQEKQEPVQDQNMDQAAQNSQETSEAQDNQEAQANEDAAKIASLEDEIADQKDQYLRLQAEFDNYRRRTAKERLELIDTANKDVLVGFLPVVDDCERALKVLKESDAAEAAIEGTELIYNKLMGYLQKKGIAKIDAMGKEFDTDFHEAVAQFPVQDPAQKNKVFDITQEGYTLNGVVVRYAKVVVGI